MHKHTDTQKLYIIIITRACASGAATTRIKHNSTFLNPRGHHVLLHHSLYLNISLRLVISPRPATAAHRSANDHRKKYSNDAVPPSFSFELKMKERKKNELLSATAPTHTYMHCVLYYMPLQWERETQSRLVRADDDGESAGKARARAAVQIRLSGPRARGLCGRPPRERRAADAARTCARARETQQQAVECERERGMTETTKTTTATSRFR